MIRDFQLSDIEEIIEILKLNDQYNMPEVDGPQAMKRFNSCNATIFLVYEINDSIIGSIRGTYDGSRAMIHQLSIHPEYQNKGFGKRLVREIVYRFQKQGAPTVSATITENSLPFWHKIGFRRTNAFLVGNW
ncbi:MAG: GNAT family N-acetyltransferase [Candidatus Hodarchaeota archaeon]